MKTATAFVTSVFALTSFPLLAQQPRSEESLVTEVEAQGVVDDPTMTKVDRKQKVWKIIWKSLIGIFATSLVALFIKGFIESDDNDFNWRETFKKALGGGLSGAAGTKLFKQNSPLSF